MKQNATLSIILFGARVFVQWQSLVASAGGGVGDGGLKMKQASKPAQRNKESAHATSRLSSCCAIHSIGDGHATHFTSSTFHILQPISVSRGKYPSRLSEVVENCSALRPNSTVLGTSSFTAYPWMHA
jgi:hypothetical protein